MQVGKRVTLPTMATLWVSLNGPNTIGQTNYLQTPAAKSAPRHDKIYFYLLVLASAFTPFKLFVLRGGIVVELQILETVP